MQENKNRLFLDMDGTMYRFHDVILDEEGQVQIDKMYEPDFFVHLETFENMVKAIQELPEWNSDIEIFVLSSVNDDDIKRQKTEVIARDFPWLDSHHQLYPKCGENKGEYVAKMTGKAIDSNDTLIDDYNKNLEEWKQCGGNAVKFINNVNHKAKGKFGGDKGNLWEGKFIHHSSPGLVHNILTQVYHGEVVEMDIRPLHCDPACAFFKERQHELEDMKRKQNEVIEQWIYFLTEPDFQSCEISFSDSQGTQLISSPTDYSKGAFQLTYYDDKKIPSRHEYYRSVDELAKKLSNYSLEDTKILLKVLYAPPTLEQIVYRATYYARSMVEDAFGKGDQLNTYYCEANQILLEALEMYGLQQYYGCSPKLENGVCYIYYSDYKGFGDSLPEKHQWVVIPEEDISIDISADRFNSLVFDPSLMAFPDVMISDDHGFSDRVCEKYLDREM